MFFLSYSFLPLLTLTEAWLSPQDCDRAFSPTPLVPMTMEVREVPPCPSWLVTDYSLSLLAETPASEAYAITCRILTALHAFAHLPPFFEDFSPWLTVILSYAVIQF